MLRLKGVWAMPLCYHSRMLRGVLTVFIGAILVSAAAAQDGVQKIVDTEHTFARRSLDVGQPQSFIEFMTDDAWAFNPDAMKAKPYYSAQKRDESVLEWAPNFADAASDGTFGYTTGNWQYRAKKGAEPSAFGEFNTIWVKQADGTYKWVVDIGTGHDKTEYSTKFVTAAVTGGRHPSPPQGDMQIFDEQAAKDAHKAYGTFASDGIRMIRRGKLPIIGSAAVKNVISGKMTFGGVIATKRASDMAFVLRPYTLGDEEGNQLQVWKYDHKLAGWVIVLDVLKPIPPK
jgi:ketosteroid isomerase-like protein